MQLKKDEFEILARRQNTLTAVYSLIFAGWIPHFNPIRHGAASD